MGGGGAQGGLGKARQGAGHLFDRPQADDVGGGNQQSQATLSHAQPLHHLVGVVTGVAPKIDEYRIEAGRRAVLGKTYHEIRVTQDAVAEKRAIAENRLQKSLADRIVAKRLDRCCKAAVTARR